MKKNIAVLIILLSFHSLCLADVTSDADFAARIADSGVVYYNSFDSKGTLAGGDDVEEDENIFSGSNGYPGIDSSVYVSGDGSNNGSLRFDLMSECEANCAGSFEITTSPIEFGEGDTFWFSFAHRISPEMLSYIGTYWDSSWKQAYWYDGPGSACTTLGIVLSRREAGPNIPAMYTQCGARHVVTQLHNESDVTDPQNRFGYYSNQTNGPNDGYYMVHQSNSNSAGYNCRYGDLGDVGTGDGEGCWYYPTNTWVHYIFKVKIGHFGKEDSHIQGWVATGGNAPEQFINVEQFEFNYNTDNTNALDYFYLGNYMTGLTPVATPGTAYSWYDELIISTRPIPAPGQTVIDIEELNHSTSVNVGPFIGAAASTFIDSGQNSACFGPDGEIYYSVGYGRVPAILKYDKGDVSCVICPNQFGDRAGTSAQAQLNPTGGYGSYPPTLKFDIDQSAFPDVEFYIADGENAEIKHAYVDGSGNWQVETEKADASLTDIISIAVATNGTVYACTSTALYKYVPSMGTLSSVSLGAYSPLGNAVDMDSDEQGNVYICNRSPANILKVDSSDDSITLLCGTRDAGEDFDGPVATAGFYNPNRVVSTPDGTIQYVGSGDEYCLRRIKDGRVSTLQSDGTWVEKETYNDCSGGPYGSPILADDNGSIWMGPKLFAYQFPIRKITVP